MLLNKQAGFQSQGFLPPHCYKWLVLVLLCLPTLVTFWPAMPTLGLDASWIQALAHSKDMQFGKDVVFTFGPWGRVYLPMYEGSDWAIAEQLMIATLWLILACRWIARHRSSWGVVLGAVLFLWAAHGILIRDTYFLIVCFFAAMAALRGTKVDNALAGGLLGLLALVKGSFLVLNGGLIGILLLRDLAKRQAPTGLVGFALCFGAGWLLLDQSLGNLSVFIKGIGEVSSGYGTAMSIPGQRDHVLVFLFLLGWFLIPEAISFKRQPDLVTGLELMATAGVLFVAFKAGFVRHDGHELIAIGSLLGVALLRACRQKKGYVGLAAIMLVTIMALRSQVPDWNAMANTLSESVAVYGKQTRMMFGWMFAPASLQESLHSEYAETKSGLAVELEGYRPSGSLDVYPTEQSLVFAIGAHWQPRPVFQSYSAYTPYLAELNRVHLRERGADELLFGLSSIDGRYPSIDDGPSWPTMLALYQPAEMVADRWLALRRAADRPHEQLRPLAGMQMALGEWLALPQSRNVPVFIRLHLVPTTWGRLANLAYKRPPVYLRVELADGRKIRHRIPEGSAAAGFIVSPYLESVFDIGNLWLEKWPGRLQSAQVLRMKVEVDAHAGPAFFEPMIGLEQFEIHGYRRQQSLPASLEAPAWMARELHIVTQAPASPVASKQGGYIDSVQQSGALLEVNGWIPMPDADKVQRLFVAVPSRPQSYQVRAIERRDVGNYLNNKNVIHAGFAFTLQFASVADAQSASKDLCIAYQSQNTDLALVKSDRKSCNRFLK